MSNYLNVTIPTFYAGMDKAFLYDEDPSPTNERIPVEVFQYTSIPQRCGLFSVMTEYGSQHARVPIQYLTSLWVDTPTAYPLDWIQLWDSISYYTSVNVIDYCKNRGAMIWLKDHSQEKAKYMFTLDWCMGPQYQAGYGEYAAGHKCGHVFEGEGGQFFIQPNNRVLWMDRTEVGLQRSLTGQTGLYFHANFHASTLAHAGLRILMMNYIFISLKKEIDKKYFSQ